jgi:hypothetical protein
MKRKREAFDWVENLVETFYGKDRTKRRKIK